MGQGECVCVLSGENTLMFDCGSLNTLDSAGETAWAWLENAGRKEIDALILSHLHEDHANGALYLFLGFLGIAGKPVKWGFYGPCPSKLS